MSHDHHESLPGFHTDQLLVDGCTECEERGRDVGHAILMLDRERFPRAWERAVVKIRVGLRTCSSAEIPMLDAIGAVAMQLEQAQIPAGDIRERLETQLR